MTAPIIKTNWANSKRKHRRKIAMGNRKRRNSTSERGEGEWGELRKERKRGPEKSQAILRERAGGYTPAIRNLR